jgi:K+-transporting ATPase ATPase C chain
VYPALVTGVAQALWPHEARGSVWLVEGRPVGSALIGRPFEGAAWFHGRPSATAGTPYNALASGGSNQGANHPALREAAAARAEALRAMDPRPRAAQPPIPAELLHASASGLDPEIGLAAALWQVPRVAAARGRPPAEVQALVERVAVRPATSLLGPPRVNVLALNLALEGRVPVRE